MVRSIHSSGVFFASGTSSKRITVPDILLDSASSLNSIHPSRDVPPLPSLHHLQLGMHDSCRNSYLSAISNLSEFAAGFCSPVVKQVEDTCLSPMASSVCLPQAHKVPVENKIFITQGHIPRPRQGLRSLRTRQLLQQHVFNPLKSLFGFSLRLFAKAFKPIHQAFLDGVQVVQTYKRHGATQVTELISNNPPTGKRDNLNFSCRGDRGIPANTHETPFEFKLLELKLSSTNLGALFKSGETPVLP
ncbi:MAG: hypothetical protein VX185_11870 [Pseudomonadota bacterium]|nr:hypothetical protein [Pseudomonadota bacterium]